jgi:microcystin-dependent protein
MSTDVSEEHIASIFKVKEAQQETSMQAGGKQSHENMEPYISVVSVCYHNIRIFKSNANAVFWRQSVLSLHYVVR